MILKDVLFAFTRELTSLYNREEAQSLFFMVLEEYMGTGRAAYALDPEREIDTGNSRRIMNAMLRLKSGEPIQHILGKVRFYGMELTVNRHTLIPRPETEELIERIRDSLSTRMSVEENVFPESILDVGTGSGCIAIALKKIYNKARVDAFDISADALEVAKANAAGQEEIINFIEGDFLKKDCRPSLSYDLIVSNPPYIAEREKGGMHVNVLEHEPHSALFVPDDDPLVFYSSIEIYARDHLTDRGHIFVEINQTFGEEILKLFSSKGWKAKLHRDMSGNNRFIEIGR